MLRVVVAARPGPALHCVPLGLGDRELGGTARWLTMVTGLLG